MYHKKKVEFGKNVVNDLYNLKLTISWIVRVIKYNYFVKVFFLFFSKFLGAFERIRQQFLWGKAFQFCFRTKQEKES